MVDQITETREQGTAGKGGLIVLGWEDHLQETAAPHYSFGVKPQQTRFLTTGVPPASQRSWKSEVRLGMEN